LNIDDLLSWFTLERVRALSPILGTVSTVIVAIFALLHQGRRETEYRIQAAQREDRIRREIERREDRLREEERRIELEKERRDVAAQAGKKMVDYLDDLDNAVASTLPKQTTMATTMTAVIRPFLDADKCFDKPNS
jgi:hypothetical protein